LERLRLWAKYQMTNTKIGLVLLISAVTLCGCFEDADNRPRGQLSSIPEVEERPTSGTSLHGKVLAIMRDGRIEPARVPALILIRQYRNDPNSPSGSSWTEANRAFEAIMPFGTGAYKKLPCTSIFRTLTLATATAMSKDPSNIREERADENGEFLVKGLLPEKYRIVALGQAGWYREVLWDDSVDLSQGDDNSITLSDIAEACQ
jgi:hypothetical protein